MARTERYTSEEVINAIRRGHTALGAAHIPPEVAAFANKVTYGRDLLRAVLGVT